MKCTLLGPSWDSAPDTPPVQVVGRSLAGIEAPIFAFIGNK